MLNVTLVLIAFTTLVVGILAGSSVDKSVVQLPARHRIGVVAFADFSRANDLGNGLIWYPLLGIGAAVLTIVAAIVVYAQGTALGRGLPLYLSAVLALLHSFTTTRAAPNMLSLRNSGDDEATLTATLDRFAKWHNRRAVLLTLNFATMLWALVAYTA